MIAFGRTHRKIEQLRAEIARLTGARQNYLKWFEGKINEEQRSKLEVEIESERKRLLGAENSLMQSVIASNIKVLEEKLGRTMEIAPEIERAALERYQALAMKVPELPEKFSPLGEKDSMLDYFEHKEIYLAEQEISKREAEVRKLYERIHKISRKSLPVRVAMEFYELIRAD